MRFGTATADVTPRFRTGMAGYGARHDQFDDIHDPLTFATIVLEERRRRVFPGAADRRRPHNNPLPVYKKPEPASESKDLRTFV